MTVGPISAGEGLGLQVGAYLEGCGIGIYAERYTRSAAGDDVITEELARHSALDQRCRLCLKSRTSISHVSGVEIEA